MNPPKTVFIGTALFMASISRANDSKDTEIIESVHALQSYAKSLDAYEGRRREELSSDFKTKKSDLEKVQKKFDQGEIEAQAQLLKKVIAKYKDQLKSGNQGNAETTIPLNLCLAYARLGDLYKELEPETSVKNYQESLNYLAPLIASTKNLLLKDQALYLKATLLEGMGKAPEALATWKQLGQSQYPSEFPVYALVALGDTAFSKNDFSAALLFFEDAEKKMLVIPNLAKTSLLTKIHYRIAWSAFRSGQHTVAIRSGLDLLIKPSPGLNQVELSQYRKDAVLLVSDSLFYQNSQKDREEFFKQKHLLNYGSMIGFRVLQRLNTSGLHLQVIKIASLILESNPLPLEYPKILNILADSYKNAGKISQWQDTMENLSMLLPANSLWRSQFGQLVAETKEMEVLAEAAASTLSASFYANGLTSNNPKSFMRAAAIYESLVQFRPTDPKSKDWRLKIAHCQYFIKNYGGAVSQYQDLTNSQELNPDQLELALYQSVKSLENQWRMVYFPQLGHSLDEFKRKEAETLAQKLSDAINRYHERFPNQSKSVDLLLVAASVYRDMNLPEKALEYWQRVLIQDAQPSQRALAMRGIIFTKIKTSGSKEVVETAGNFLKLENWKSLGQNLYLEMNGVLSTALLNEAERLRSQGQITEAGSLLTDHGSRFPDLPDLERIQRDGAYYYAVSGHWRFAEIGAQKYLESPSKQYRADMQYLLARSAEYQLKIKDAATNYFKLARDFPSHTKSKIALDRSESLAAAEGLTDLSIEIALFRSAKTGIRSEKLKTLDQAISLNIDSGNYNQAEKIARSRLRSSDSLAEKLTSRLMLAEISYLAGTRQEALDELKILDQQVRTNRNRLPRTDFSVLIGKINLLRGRDVQSKFNDYRIDANPDQLAARINTKSQLFAALARNFDTVIAMGTIAQASEARFYVANAAESLANEISGVPIKSQLPVTLKTANRNRSTIERLQNLAQQYYSQNILLSRQNPPLYAGNEWIKKSAGRLNHEKSTSGEQKFLDMTPIASQGGQISQWNLNEK